MSKPTSASDRGRRGGLRRDERGSTMVEFGLILPALMAVTVGLIDVTVAMLDYHRLGEATRSGARQAVISGPVANLNNLPTLDTVTCTKNPFGTLACEGQPVLSSANFDAVLTAMQAIKPEITAQNIEITYTDSEIGDITNPGGLKPLITVALTGMTYELNILDFIPGIDNVINLPAFAASQLGSGYTQI